MKRVANPTLSATAESWIERYGQDLRNEQDLSDSTVRNYLSDLRHFAAWCEMDGEAETPFAPEVITTPTITRYRAYLQGETRLLPASVNRSLVSIKRFCSWAVDAGHLQRDPSRPAKLVTQEPRAPRHLTDREEEALVAATGGQGRNYTLLVLMLHTGLRASEVCGLQREHVRLAKKSGTLVVWGKRRKFREVPLNATARRALEAWLAELPDEGYVFPSQKTGGALTTRALGQIVSRYARAAHVDNVHPHDLRHRFGYRMAETVPLHRLAQIMGHDSLDTTRIYTQATAADLQREVEKIAWE